MKFKKTLRVFCSAITLSLICSFGNVAKAQSNPLSMYAGKNVQVYVNYITSNGEVDEQVVQVYIPENTPVQEGNEMIRTAALCAENGGYRSVQWQGDLLYAYGGAPGGDGFTITTTASKKGGTTLTKDYDELIIEFHGITVFNQASTINVRLEGTGMTNVYTGGEIGKTFDDMVCTIFIMDGQNYGDGTTNFSQDSTFDLYCSVNTGYIKCLGMIVSAL